MMNIRNLFSVEITSKKYVKNLSISDETYDRVFFEGDLGELVELSLIDGEMLEITGQFGVIRTSMNALLLQRLLDHPKRVLSLSSKLSAKK